ncbi:MAG TPA: SGNH/GDSL hydrolase family protein [Planktothrix sp.]|jgi:lysophospholipase L1-like esterase
MTVAAPSRSSIGRPDVIAKKSGNPWATFAVVVAFQLLALMFVEGVLYWAGLGEEDIYKMDKTIGFHHFPNKRVTWRSEGYSVSYFDADGMREPGLKIQKAPGVYRIALLGDSVVEGLQVPLEQTFGKLLEKRLNQQGKRSIEVVNFANSGYSTVQEYLELKDKVFKYQPDLVVLGYMNRDMFENWTAPDQTITNVRPIALQLPGQPLVVDYSPVKKWMRTPRGKFMMAFEWVRQNSRIWGLISATTLQLSISDPFYRGMMAFFGNPRATTQDWFKQAQHFKLSQLVMPSMSPSFSIKFFEGNKARRLAKREAMVQSSIMRAPANAPKVELVMEPQLRVKKNSAQAKPQGETNDKSAPDSKIGTNAIATKPVSDAAAEKVDLNNAKNGNANYVKLMTNTLNALLEAMQFDCKQHGSKFAVVLMPSRAELCPTPGMETNFFNLTYKDEEKAVTDSCEQLHIPYFNSEAVTETEIPQDKRADMFYLMHFNGKGHATFANEAYPFFAEQVGQSVK